MGGGPLFGSLQVPRPRGIAIRLSSPPPRIYAASPETFGPDFGGNQMYILPNSRL